MDPQKRYTRCLRDASTLCAKTLSNFNKSTVVTYVDAFIVEQGMDADNRQLSNFTRDLVRHLRRISVTRSKESVGKLMRFLENCPDQLDNYHE